MKELLLKKGWAGRTISREETVDRLNPLIRQHTALNHAYGAALEATSEADVRDWIGQSQRTARADVGKLAETVFSNGGTAYSGVDLEPSDFDLGEGDDRQLFQLRDLEQAFQDALTRELKETEHHMRTRAVLGVVQTNSQARLNQLEQLTRKRHR